MTLENTTPRYVDIVFENCEVCRVNIEDIGQLSVGNIAKELFLQLDHFPYKERYSVYQDYLNITSDGVVLELNYR